MKKVSLILALLILLLTSGCSVFKPQLKDDVYIFFTSDVHCGVDENLGFKGLQALINDTKAEHEYVTLVDLGDYLQGGTLGALSKGSMIIDLMNEMNYDIVTFGNHEFDYGMERLQELMKAAKFDFVACNVKYSGTGVNTFENVPGYVIRKYGGVKVAFIGVLTPNSITSSSPTYFMEDGKFVYDFYSGEDGMALAEVVQQNVDKARSQGAQYVIVLSHLGTRTSDSPYSSIELIRNTSGIDAVLDGHAHAVIYGDTYPNKNGEDVLVASVGTKMENAGELIIGKDGTISVVLISEYDSGPQEVMAAIDSAKSKQDEILKEKITEIDFDLSVTDEKGIRLVRSREVGLADLVADAFREELGTDIFLINGGGVRATIPSGPVTYQSLLNVMPFMNSLSVCKATGQQVLDALEFGCKETQKLYAFEDNAVGEFGGFLQVSGLKYTIDTSIPSGVVMDENNMMTDIVGERRVKDVYVLQNGEYVPLDPEATYTVGSNDYIITKNGDGNTAFAGCELLIEAGPTDIDLLINHIKKIKTIPETYALPEGRITVK